MKYKLIVIKILVLFVVLEISNSLYLFADSSGISSFFKSKTKLASKYDKYVEHEIDYNRYEEYILEVYWQVTRSDSKYSSLSQTETHRQMWIVREEENAQIPFSIVSGKIRVPITGSVSDYISHEMKRIQIITMDRINLAKLLGLDEKQLEQGDSEETKDKVIFLYVGEGFNEQNSFTFKLLPEDYYEVRIELKMQYSN